MSNYIKHLGAYMLCGLSVLGVSALADISPTLQTARSNHAYLQVAQTRLDDPELRRSAANPASAIDHEALSREMSKLVDSRLPEQGVELTYINPAKAEKEIVAESGDWSEGVTSSARIKAPRKAPGVLPEGVMFSKDVDLNSPLYEANQLVLTRTSSTTWLVKGIYGLSTNIEAQVDSAAGTISIKAQGIFANSRWGDLSMCPVDGNSYNPAGEITGYFDADGNVELGSWGIFVTSGQYAGYCVAAYKSTRWLVPNTVVRTTGPREQDTTSYKGAIEQQDANTVNIYSLLAYNNVIVGTLTPSKTIVITPQKLYQATAGTVLCYPIETVTEGGEEKMLINFNGNVTGESTPEGLKLNPWTAAVKGVGSAFVLETTTITTDYKLTYPAPLAAEWGGTGTKTDPYRLANASDLLMLAQKVGEGNTYQGYNFTLSGDIDMSTADRAFTGIGSVSAHFEGNLDGAGHTIRNLNCNGYGAPSAGLFGWLGQASTVKNLSIENAVVTGEGANVGILAGTADGTIDNVNIFTSRIKTSGEATGGMVGQLNGTITNSSFRGSVSGKGLLGGLVAFNAGVVDKCHAIADVQLTGVHSQTYHHAGGLCGAIASTALGNGKGVARDSYFSGNVVDNTGSSYVGGLACMASRGTVERCFNVGTVQGLRSAEAQENNYSGGLLAYVTESHVKDCYNAGTVFGRVEGSAEMRAVGGLFGYVSVSRISSAGSTRFGNLSTIENCYNSGMVFSANENTQEGVYGRTWDGLEKEVEELTFSNTYNDASICHGDTSAFARPTDYFLSTTLPAGFSSEVWVANTGRYPMLRSTAEAQEALLSAAAILYPATSWPAKTKGEVVLSKDGSVAWGLLNENATPVLSVDNASISGSILKVGDDYSNEVLVAYTPGGGMKYYSLGLVPAGMYQGEGTQDNPFVLASVADWKNLDRAVNVFAQTHEGDFFRMSGDIDFKGSDFHGVGALNQVNTFDGTLDGEGHTVHNLTIATANVNDRGVLQKTGNYWHGGLFSLIGKKGKVANLNIAADASVTVYHYGAALVGQLLGTVENCRNYADVKCYGAYGAGIAGVVRDCGKVIGCYNAGTVNTTKDSGTGAAGIAGYNIGYITLSQNDGAITLDVNGKTSAGGIAAYNSGRIDNCVNTAVVTAPNMAGGIVGQHTVANASGHLNGNINTGLVVLSKDGVAVGGIAGTADGYRSAANNYYDSSINVDGAVESAGHPSMKGLATATLVSGKAPEGVNAADYDLAEGLYPVLKNFAGEEAGRLARSVYVKFDDSQVRNNMKRDVPLSSTEGVEWLIAAGETEVNPHFSIDNGVLKVTVPSDMSLGSAVLNAMNGENVVKSFALKSLPVYLTGEGTEEAPYLINNVDDFTKLANFVNTTLNDYKGVNFKLMNDLDFEGAAMTMIAGAHVGKNNMVKFQGKLDGNGKTIRNFNVAYDNHTTAVYSGGDRYGIVGALGEAGEIRNLTSEGKFAGMRWIAGIAGECYGLIENCVNRSEISATGSEASGGIAGRAYAGARIIDCSNFGSVYVTATYGGGGIAGDGQDGAEIRNCVNEGVVKGGSKAKNLGGIIGRSGGLIADCTNKGKIESEAPYSASPMSFFGGIVGAPTYASHIVNCVNESDLTLENQTSVGGIFGGVTGAKSESNTLRVDSCVNRGAITALGTVGGLFGFVPAGAQIADCANYGVVKTVFNGTAYNRAIGSASQGTRHGHAGGVAGYVAGVDADFKRTLITRTFNAAAVDNGMDFSGGLTAYLASGATLDRCYNSGTLTSISISPALNGYFTAYHVGGLVGDHSGTITRCWNSGDVVADGHDIGGIAGLQSSRSVLDKVVNLGKVTVNRSAANDAVSFQPIGGGVIGRANGSTNRNFINLGDVTSPDRAAGIVSMLFMGNPTTVVANGYNYAKLTNTNENASLISHVGNYRDAEESFPDVSNIFYVKDQNPNVGANLADTRAGKGVTLAEMRSAALGDEFIISRASLPMVKDLWHPGVPHFAVAGIAYRNESDSETSVTDIIDIANLEELVWTGSEGMEIIGSTAVPRKTGAQWLKVATADGQLEKQFDFTVTKAVTAVMPTGITLDRTDVDAIVGEEFTLKATLSPDNVTEAESVVKWSSSNPEVAEVVDGKVKCLAPGTVTINAVTVNEFLAQCIVTIHHIMPESITLAEHTRTANVGDVFTIEVVLGPDNCTERTITWSVDNRQVCMVDEEGRITVLSPGDATVKATTANGLSDSCEIKAMSGVDGIYFDGKEVVAVEYYSLDGLRLASPADGEIAVVRYRFADGSVKTLKWISDSVKK